MLEQKTTGLIHLYCGEGKGKTTAALGLGLRMAGYGRRVLVVQFLKSSPTGELISLARIPEIRVLRRTEELGFTFQMDATQKIHARQLQQALFQQGIALASDPKEGYALLVLDEIMAGCSSGMIDPQQVADFLRKKPEELEVVLTGRNPPEILLDLADYVSEIKKRKHPFDQGIPAREGIEQ